MLTNQTDNLKKVICQREVVKIVLKFICCAKKCSGYLITLGMKWLSVLW